MVAVTHQVGVQSQVLGIETTIATDPKDWLVTCISRKEDNVLMGALMWGQSETMRA